MDWKTALTGLRQDLSYAVRLLRREPGFSLVAILTLALGIGASATLFTAADAVLLRPLPWPEPDRLVRVEERRGGLTSRRPWTLTNGTYHAWAEAPQSIESIGAWMPQMQTLTGSGDPERLSVALTTPSLFAVLKARPEHGRVFVEEDSEFGRSGTVILSDGLWRRRLGADPNAIGRTIQLGGRAFEIIGVMPAGFAFPDRDTQAWVAFRPPSLLSRDGRQMRLLSVGAIARLRSGVTAAEAADEATARVRTVPDIQQAALSLFGSRGEASVAVVPALEILTAESRPAILLLLGAVGLLLLASTASVLGVQLARASARRYETAIRTAVGAGRARLARLWLVESALIGVCAGILGIGFAAALCRLLPSLLPADLPRVDAISVDARSMIFALALTSAVSIICGMVPAVLSKPSHLSGSLSEDGGAPMGVAVRTRVGRMRSGIIVGQVAIACVLLIGGALLARSFMAMVNADRGYNPSGLLTAKLTFPDSHAGGATQNVQILETLQERLLAIDGVSDVAFGNGLPLVHHGNVFGGTVPSPRDAAQKIQIAATWRVVSPKYFDALRMRFAAGHPLPSGTTPSSPGVIVVNRSFAREYLGPQPIGQRLQLALSSQPEWEVVGVVEDVRQGNLSEPTKPEFFASYQQVPDGLAFDPMLLIRTQGDRMIDAGTLKGLVRDVSPAIVIDSIMTMEDRVMTSLARPRAYALVLGGLATLALTIAGVGLFGVLSYTIAQRTREIGVRLALGAEHGHIMRLVLRQAAVMIGLGLTVGVVITILSVEALSKILYGVGPHDVGSFAIAAAAIALVAAAACVVPIRRAISVDPVRALRSR